MLPWWFIFGSGFIVGCTVGALVVGLMVIARDDAVEYPDALEEGASEERAG